jgi:hypothetical protein
MAALLAGVVMSDGMADTFLSGVDYSLKGIHIPEAQLMPLISASKQYEGTWEDASTSKQNRGNIGIDASAPRTCSVARMRRLIDALVAGAVMSCGMRSP